MLAFSRQALCNFGRRWSTACCERSLVKLPTDKNTEKKKRRDSPACVREKTTCRSCGQPNVEARSTRCMRVSSGCASPLVLSASQHRPVRERLRSGLDDAKRNLQFTVTRCGQPTGRFRFVACKSSDAASLYARLLEWNTVRHLTWCTPFLGTRVSRTVCGNDTRQKDNLPALSPAGLASSLSIFA